MDLSPILRGADSGHADRPIFIHYPHQWYRDIGVGLGIQPFTSMRKGPWKLIYFYGDGYRDGEGLDPWFELYDLSQDPLEQQDLAGLHEEDFHRLWGSLSQWMQQGDSDAAETAEGEGHSEETRKALEALGYLD